MFGKNSFENTPYNCVNLNSGIEDNGKPEQLPKVNTPYFSYELLDLAKNF